MKLLYQFYLCCIIASLSSCVAIPYYLPATSGNDITYLPKPMSSDSLKVKNYISASYANLTLPHETGELSMGFLNFSRAHTTKNLNIAYGAFGFAGKTFHNSNNLQATSADFSGNTFLGAGLRSAIGYYEVSGATEFRILSWENALSWENGNYANFRKSLKAQQLPHTIVSDFTTVYTTGLSSEIIFHARNNQSTQFAFRMFYGYSPGLRKNLLNEPNMSLGNGVAADFSFFFKTKRFFGIYSLGGNKGFSSKVSLGYSF